MVQQELFGGPFDGKITLFVPVREDPTGTLLGYSTPDRGIAFYLSRADGEGCHFVCAIDGAGKMAGGKLPTNKVAMRSIEYAMRSKGYG